MGDQSTRVKEDMKEEPGLLETPVQSHGLQDIVGAEVVGWEDRAPDCEREGGQGVLDLKDYLK